jgi:hypothetical protein
MFPSKHTIARLAGGFTVAAALASLSAPAALGHTTPYGGYDPWFKNAIASQHSQPDPWFNNALAKQRSLATPTSHSKQTGYRFITDTLAPGGSAPVQGYRFITDTLAPGGSAPVQGYRFITDTLAPGGGASPVGTQSSPPGFNWADAGIGAGAVVSGLIVLLGGTLLTVRRRNTIAL